MKRGLFVVFEGGEGSGKSTQIKLLASRMREAGCDVVETKEPGGTPLGLELRKIILNPKNTNLDASEEITLFYTDRALHLAFVVRPGLSEGKLVISDRYYFSTWAYQHKGRGVPFDVLLDQHNKVVDIEPDLVILLDIDPEIGLARKHAQNEITRMENEKLEFHQRVNQAFRDFAENDPQRWHLVDASEPIEEIHEKIWQRVADLISA